MWMAEARLTPPADLMVLLAEINRDHKRRPTPYTRADFHWMQLAKQPAAAKQRVSGKAMLKHLASFVDKPNGTRP
jgi:hypothetical protein